MGARMASHTSLGSNATRQRCIGVPVLRDGANGARAFAAARLVRERCDRLRRRGVFLIVDHLYRSPGHDNTNAPSSNISARYRGVASRRCCRGGLQ